MTSSSIITGAALNGSSTPPIWPASRQYTHAICNVEPARGNCVFVHESEALAASYCVEFTKPKTQQNALLDPNIDRPLSSRLLRSANCPLGQLVAEVKENLACIFRECLRRK